MAITTATVGRVDIPPVQQGNAGQPTKLSQWIVDVTMGSNGDYVNGTGLSLATAVTAIGATTIVGAQLISIRTTGGAWKQTLAGSTTYIATTLDSFTSATPQLRIWVAPTAGGAYIEATGATHFVNGDIVRVMLWGY